MRPVDGQFESLRLEAKAADRAKAAEAQWPEFDARLKQLGYGTRAIAHAFRTLRGSGSVEDALRDLHG